MQGSWLLICMRVDLFFHTNIAGQLLVPATPTSVSRSNLSAVSAKDSKLPICTSADLIFLTKIAGQQSPIPSREGLRNTLVRDLEERAPVVHAGGLTAASTLELQGRSPQVLLKLKTSKGRIPGYSSELTSASTLRLQGRLHQGSIYGPS